MQNENSPLTIYESWLPAKQKLEESDRHRDIAAAAIEERDERNRKYQFKYELDGLSEFVTYLAVCLIPLFPLLLDTPLAQPAVHEFIKGMRLDPWSEALWRTILIGIYTLLVWALSAFGKGHADRGVGLLMRTAGLLLVVVIPVMALSASLAEAKSQSAFASLESVTRGALDKAMNFAAQKLNIPTAAEKGWRDIFINHAYLISFTLISFVSHLLVWVLAPRIPGAFEGVVVFCQNHRSDTTARKNTNILKTCYRDAEDGVRTTLERHRNIAAHYRKKRRVQFVYEMPSDQRLAKMIECHRRGDDSDGLGSLKEGAG